MTRDEGFVGRMMNGSVDRALRMQRGRVKRVADDLLYASPSQRDLVAVFAEAGRRLVEGGLAPRTLGTIAQRRTETSVTRTARGTDLSHLDNRSLESTNLDEDNVISAALRCADAAIVGWPPALLAVGTRLEAVASISRHLPTIDASVGPNRIVLSDDGSCLAVAPSIATAIGWLEIAEHAAIMQLRRTS